MKAFNKIITYVLIVAVLLGVFGLFYAFVGNGQSNYYVEYGNKQISRKRTNIELPKNAYSLFYVKSILFDKSFVSADDYEVNIYLDRDNVADIGFTVDGIKYGLHGDIDFSQAFKVDKQDGFFIIYLSAENSISQILQACYPNKTIVVDEDIPLWESDCFQVIITFLVENKTVAISFH